MLRRVLYAIVAIALLAALAALADVRVANWANAHDLLDHGWPERASKVVKWLGDYRITLAAAALIIAINYHRWRAAVFVATAGIVAGLLYTLVKWTIGRTRPFPKGRALVPAFELHPFANGIPGLWTAENQAFPSGHACLAFATAVALGIVFPRGRPMFYLLALLVCVERVLEAAHYTSDVVGGALIGAIAAWLTAALLRRFAIPSTDPELDTIGVRRRHAAATPPST